MFFQSVKVVYLYPSAVNLVSDPLQVSTFPAQLERSRLLTSYRKVLSLLRLGPLPLRIEPYYNNYGYDESNKNDHDDDNDDVSLRQFASLLARADLHGGWSRQTWRPGQYPGAGGERVL